MTLALIVLFTLNLNRLMDREPAKVRPSDNSGRRFHLLSFWPLRHIRTADRALAWLEGWLGVEKNLKRVSAAQL